MGTIFQIIALILLIVAACGVGAGRFQLGWAGLAFYVAAPFVARLAGGP